MFSGKALIMEASCAGDSCPRGGGGGRNYDAWVNAVVYR